MSAAPTLNSRLRVLVAKTFRAEKLYSSIRNAQGEKLSSPTVLTQMANDIRAKEWQRSHYQLRVSLNDILAQGGSAQATEELIQLRQRFSQRADESLEALETGTQALVEDARRHEFAHIFKISIELIRHKARAQANKVVVDELNAVLDASGKQGATRQTTGTVPSLKDVSLPELPSDLEANEQPRNNVIPLRRRAANGGRDSS